MQIRPLKLSGTFEILLNPRRDERGYFMRVIDNKIFQEHGLTTAWVQENQSRSTRKGLLRGLHYQRPPHAETKLVRAVAGVVLDVFVDLRRQSPTYGAWDAVELSVDRLNIVYIPRGFAHGFCTLTEDAIVLYKVDAYYAPESEDGLRWNDDDLKIPWPVDNPYISPKDAAWPLLREREPVLL